MSTMAGKGSSPDVLPRALPWALTAGVIALIGAAALLVSRRAVGALSVPPPPAVLLAAGLALVALALGLRGGIMVGDRRAPGRARRGDVTLHGAVSLAVLLAAATLWLPGTAGWAVGLLGALVLLEETASWCAVWWFWPGAKPPVPRQQSAANQWQVGTHGSVARETSPTNRAAAAAPDATPTPWATPRSQGGNFSVPSLPDAALDVQLSSTDAAAGADRDALVSEPSGASRGGETVASAFATAATSPERTTFGDSEALPPEATQHFTRWQTADGVDRLAGWLRVTFDAGQRSEHAHLAFCPAFAKPPRIEVSQLNGPRARVKTAQILPHGARLDLKLAGPAAEQGESLLLHVEAATE